jgi:integrase
MDFRMLRRTFATHFKKHGDPKDLQSAMRHADVTMSLEVYQQEIPEETFRAVSSYEDEIMALVEAA